MQSKLKNILISQQVALGADGIYSARTLLAASSQVSERELRERVAARQYDNYLLSLSLSHSIPVMDYEVDRFVASLPRDAVILDIGGCWGWHWRRLATARSDVGVLIVDFVRGNLQHAQRLLGALVGTQVALLHADATELPFTGADDASFDGVWSVQTLQHVSDFAGACSEAHRVLKKGSRFINYSLHVTPLNRFVHKILGKTFHVEGVCVNQFLLNRANNNQRQIVSNIFGGEVVDRYTELLFHPDLRFTFSGKPGCLLGWLDSRLGNLPYLGRWIARQRSFEAVKN